MLERFSLEGRIAFVTGASRGLGRALALALAEAGATVAVAGRDEDALGVTATCIRERGRNASVHAFDVRDTRATADAVTSVADRWGRLDILVANAGISIRRPLEEHTIEAWREVIDVDLTACFVLGREAGLIMKEAGYGRLVFIASIMGTRLSRPTIPGYSAAKAGIEGLTRSFAVELGPFGVTSNAIAPGFFKTEMNRPLLEDPEVDSKVRSRVALRRWAEPDELAGAAVFLASHASSYVTGQTLLVDGGVTVSW
ncbi:gluconate 5-dehydrogenase [Skermanella aerolata]|uniref:SDR family NAD(P)-dependent oxidoreductase n=1 Tax=Skermanella aerolata TaxID=393310 RepID=UPI003D1AAD8D